MILKYSYFFHVITIGYDSMAYEYFVINYDNYFLCHDVYYN